MCSKNLPPALFEKLFLPFMKKLDDNCFMCSDGVLKVIGNGDQKQLDKNLQCGQCSITVLRSGSVAESDRPV